ncbi:uncharacterized protein TNCV_1895711 [Trichonephila clavipes]|nr:uncharacterized protein TNCV_1895711 [Trichonephila clavipes]
MERTRNPVLTLQYPEIDNYGGRVLMIWSDIMLDGLAPLHVFERGSVTGVSYRDEIVEPYVCLFRDG